MLKSKNKFPLLQIALDFTETERAMKVAIEAVKEGVEWVEAGTPLIKSEGIGVVRALKKEFPNKTVIADMEIMDTG